MRIPLAQLVLTASDCGCSLCLFIGFQLCLVCSFSFDFEARSLRSHTYTAMSGSGSNTLQLDDFDEDNIRIGVVRETMNSNPLLVKVRGVCLPTRLLYFLSSFLPSWLRCQRVLYHLHIQAPLGKPKLNTRNPNQVYGVKSKKVSCAPSMQLFLVFVCASFSSD